MKVTRVGLIALALIITMALLSSACGGGAATPAPAPTSAPVATSTAVPVSTATQAPTGTAASVAPTVIPRPTPTAVPATPTPTGPQPRYGGTLRSREIREWANWYTYHTGGFPSASIMQNVFSNLIWFDPAKPSTIIGDLAERWEESPDGKTITFSLRKGVKWHDGKDLTSADVVWNLERALKGEAPITYNKSRFINVASVEAPDPSTVRVIMKRPQASFVPNMATPYMLMYAPHGPAPASPEFKDKPIGTGAFKFKSRQVDVSQVFARNESYYKKDEAGRAMPYLDAINTFIISDPTAGLSAFRASKIDCGCTYDTDFLTANKQILEREVPGVKLTLANTDRFVLFFNQKEPWTNPLVRQAIFTALDRNTIKGLYRLGQGFYPPNFFLSTDLGGAWGLPSDEMSKFPGFRLKDGKKDPADLEEAKRLFAQAGVSPDKLKVAWRVAKFFSDLGEATEAALSQIGLKVEFIIDPTSSDPFYAQGAFDMGIMAGGTSFDDPSDRVPLYFLSNGAANFGKWQRPETDALYQRLEDELEPAKRKQLAHELQRKLLAEYILTPLAYSPSVYGTHKQVFGYSAPAFGISSAYRLERLWLD